MSEVYIHEPSTKGTAVFQTTYGDLQVELWATECPKACRNFCQLILEGYYNGTLFHRVIRDFIVQGGDKTGSGDSCESIYGKPYADEIHPRLKFRYRGMLGIASAGKGTKTNGSQFFITLNRAPSLDGKHTLFGKVVGQTVYNLIKISEVQVDKNDKPLEPPRIIRAELTWDPFGDLEPRCTPAPPLAEKSGEEQHRRAPVHNKRVLSFAASDGEDEDDDRGAARGKSAHDLLSDPKLSREAAYPSQPPAKSSRKRPAEEKGESSRKGGGERPSSSAPSGQAPAGQAEARRKPAKAAEGSDSGSSSEDDGEEGGAVQQEKASKRQATIAMLKRDIAGLASGGAAEPAPERKPQTALEEQRVGYTTRGKTKALGRAGKAEKKQKAVQVQDKIKSFTERIRSIQAGGEEEEGEEKAGEEKKKKKGEEKEEGTFAAIWQEGDEEGDKDWLSGAGLKFHVTADKAFKLDSLKARENLEIFDPLAAKGNDTVLAEARKKRSEQMRPMMRRKEPPKKW